jgi:hypothetical protein
MVRYGKIEVPRICMEHWKIIENSLSVKGEPASYYQDNM